MRRILFLLLCINLLAPLAYGAIEIYANGHKYDSLQAYLVSKKSAVVKTSQVSRKNLSDSTRHKLYVLSIENGMVSALQDFYMPGTLIGRTITSKQLQGAIQQAVTASQDPKLLISKPGKVRIMALDRGK
jgi:hypothetical protein